MAFSAIAAIAAAASAAAGVGGSVIGANNAQQANATQAAIARNNQQNALNQQQYQQALNALAMKRSLAGTVDGLGSKMVYDPATNSWTSSLGPEAAAVQHATDQASISRNTTDLAAAQEANRMATRGAIPAQSAADQALAAIRNYKPITAQQLEGDLQQTSTIANRQAQQPIIADTLRQFARTGTAAGPVLTQMMRDNATSLRSSMLNDKIAAEKNVGDINNANLSPLLSKYQTLNNAAHPNLQFSGIDQTNPNNAMITAMAQRAGAASQPASQGAFASAYGTNVTNNANQFAAQHPGTSNLGASIVGTGNQIQDLFSPNGAIAKYFTNNNNTPTDAFGNTVGADKLNQNWLNTAANFGVAGDSNRSA